MKRNAKYMAACLALVIVGGVVAGFTSSGGTPRAETISPERAAEIKLPQASEIRGYRAWAKVNPQPVPITSEVVAVLCRAPTPGNIMHDAGRSPHAGKLITVYVNNTGRDAMMAQLKPKFPVGSVIVKEKLSSGKEDEPELLTVMIKRESGFNPTVGDWEFLAINGAGTKIDARGRLESCQSCHVMMKDTDFVSRSYLPDELRSKLR